MRTQPQDQALLLDTHVWLWLAFDTPGKITGSARQLFDEAHADSPLWVSIISVWEIALLEAKARLRLPMAVTDWVAQAFANPALRLLPIEHPRIAIDSCNLPGNFHADPADRFLVATARIFGMRLVTNDQKILAYGRDGHVLTLDGSSCEPSLP